jgi:uncharacterized protein
LEKTIDVARAMKKMHKNELAKTLQLSANLADTTYEYWQNFQIEIMTKPTYATRDSKPCIYTYSGAAYQGIQIHECNVDTIIYLQDNLRILDALYGVLRPLDQIQPYRLEMDTKNITLPYASAPIPKLSTYWSETITERLVHDLQEQQSNNANVESAVPLLLLNLASDEYSSTVNVSMLPSNCRYIKVIFWEDHRVVAVHAKRARGLMVRFLAERHATTMDDIQQFNVEGYQYVSAKSNDQTLVFNRPKQQPVPKTTQASSGSGGGTSSGRAVRESSVSNKRSKRS